MDIPGSGKTRSSDGRPGSSYDDMDATGTVASGTDGADGSGGFVGTAYGVATTCSSSNTPGSRSYGNSLPHVSLLAASSPSTPLVIPTRADLETVKRMMEGDTYIGRGCRQCRLTRMCVWKSVQTLRLRQIASCGQVSTTPRRFARTQQSADQLLRSQIAVSLQALPAVPRRRNHCEVC